MDFTISLYDYKVRQHEPHRALEEDPVIGAADMSPRSTHHRFIQGYLDDEALATALRVRLVRGLPLNATQGEAFVRALADALAVDARVQVGWDSVKQQFGLFDTETREFVIHGGPDMPKEWRTARARAILEQMGVKIG